MALSYDQIREIRSWVGEAISENDLDEKYDRLNSMNAVIMETLMEQLAAYRDQPTSITVPGVSVTFSDRIRTLQETIKMFNEIGGVEGDEELLTGVMKVHRLVRPDYR